MPDDNKNDDPVDLDIQSSPPSGPERKEWSSLSATHLAPIFRTDPVLNYLLSALPPAEKASYLPLYFRVLMRAAALNAATFQHLAAWSCIAVWLPPRRTVANPWTLLPAGFVGVVRKLRWQGVRKMLGDFSAQTDAAKKRHLRARGVREYWYLFFLGTREESRGQGLASRVVRAWQRGARGLPIWLEATTERSRRVYERCGFRVCEEIVLGRGTHGAEGEEKRGGEGVRIWGMVWMPGEEERKA